MFRLTSTGRVTERLEKLNFNESHALLAVLKSSARFVLF